MMVLITYDVSTETAAGRKRLRQIAKQCVNYGQRVQNSVFECVLDAAQCKQLQHKLTGIMNKTGCTVIFINQLREKIGVMFGNPENSWRFTP